MFSIVCVYNDEIILQKNLIDSLKRQKDNYELILIDNIDNKFNSAAKALNYGGKKTTNEYIIFMHQDIILTNNNWLDTLGKELTEISNLGIAGCTGVNKYGKYRGFIRDRFFLWGSPIFKVEEVETLDENLLIIPKKVFSELKFDETNFPSWHCYGADYCLVLKQKGLKVCVIPKKIFHNSPATNIIGLIKSQRQLFYKHKDDYRIIHTTCGNLSWFRILLSPVLVFLQNIFLKIFPSFYMDIQMKLEDELAQCEKILDLGWERNSPIQVFMTDNLREKEITTKDITKKWELEDLNYDAIIALDILEHLTKKEAHDLILKMSECAKIKVILLTHNILSYNQLMTREKIYFDFYETNWKVFDFKNMGFKVYGVNGSRFLRGHEKSLASNKMAIIYLFFHYLIRPIIFYLPSQASELFCVKDIFYGDDDLLKK